VHADSAECEKSSSFGEAQFVGAKVRVFDLADERSSVRSYCNSLCNRSSSGLPSNGCNLSRKRLVCGSVS